MPRETLRDIPSGPGSVDPSLTQQVSVQPVSPSFRPARDQLEKLRNALFAAGSALASGLSITADNRERLRRKKEEVVQEQEAEIAGIQEAQEAEVRLRSQRRLEREAAMLQQIQLDRRAENPEWLLQQAEARYNNSQTQDERDIWFGLIGSARQRLAIRDRDRQREVIEDINLAAMTAGQVVSDASVELQNDAALQSELIGDGRNIPGRVQDWILATVQAASPDLFDIRQGDPNFQERVKQRDRLMAQLIKLSTPIADRLVKQYMREVNSQNEQTASQKLDALFTGALTGENTGTEDLATDIGAIEELLLSHMTEGGKAAAIAGAASKALSVAASGGLERNIVVRIQAAESILNASGMSEIDKAMLRERFREDLAADVGKGFIDSAKERIMTLSASRIDTDPSSPFFGQRRNDLPDPNAASTLALDVNERGESGYHQVAREYLATIGLDPEGDNPLVRAVMEEADELTSKGIQAVAREIERERSISAYLRNDLGGDAKAAWETSPAFMSQTPTGMDEQALARLSVWLPEDQRDAVNRLAGGPVANVPETRNIRAAIWGGLAAETNEAVNYAVPDQVWDKVGRDWTGGDQEDMWNSVSYFRQIQNKQRFLADFGSKHGLQAAVAMNIAANKMFKARKSGPVPDWAEVVQDAQNIMASTDLLSRQDRLRPATDAQGRRLIRDVDGREVEVSKKQQALVEIMGAIQQTDLLVDPLNLHPDQDLDVYFGVPEEERSLFAQGLQILSLNAFSVFGPPSARIGVEEASESDPAAIEAFLDQSLQGFGEANLDNLLDVFFGLRASGHSVEDSAVGVVGFMANAGLTISDTGSGPKIRFDPAGALGPNRQNYGALREDVERWLDQDIPAEEWGRVNAKFKDAHARFKDPAFFAVHMRDVPHLVMPHRFLSPEDPNWTPPQWRFATEEASWLQGVQNGGAPLMFLTQDANPEWVMITDPDTNMPVFGFNYHEMGRVKSIGQRMAEVALEFFHVSPQLPEE